jgi:DTW domain-containing protein YfiP
MNEDNILPEDIVITDRGTDFFLIEETPFEVASARIVAMKDKDSIERKTRCFDCWKTPLTCICPAIDCLRSGANGCLWRQSFHKHPIRILIYMSREEWRCGGNSGKAIHLLFPNETELFVHGVRSDALRLRAAVRMGNVGRTVILFPGPDAQTIPQWVNAVKDISGHGTLSQHIDSELSTAETVPITIILVDGTWRQARRMAKHLTRNIVRDVLEVSLSSSETISIFHRRQSEEGRICTAEALSMAVNELFSSDFFQLSDSSVSSRIVGAFHSLIIDAIRLTNRAIAPTKMVHNWQGHGGHPAWYYGVRIADGKSVDDTEFANV